MYEIRLKKKAAKQFDDLPLAIRARITRLIERLQNWPEVSGVKPLRGGLAGHFRLRTGDYRLQFRVAGRVIIVEKIGHRDGFYEE